MVFEQVIMNDVKENAENDENGNHLCEKGDPAQLFPGFLLIRVFGLRG
jgi:hypothetical protein